MGDMKTPDFDDLLAAFDIPDATGLDAKEPIQGGHEEAESQLKHAGMCLDDSLLSNQAVTASDIPAVSVIVKNTSRQESLGDFEDRLHTDLVLQNGFTGQESSIDSEINDPGFSKSFVSALNGETSREFGKAPIQHKPDAAIFSQSVSHFSPISSPESEDTPCNRDEGHPTQEKPSFPEAPDLVKVSVPENPPKVDLGLFNDCPKDSDIPKNTQSSRTESCQIAVPSDGNEMDLTPKVHSAIHSPISKQNFESTCNSGTTKDIHIPFPFVKAPTSKLSSCLEALAALNARKDPNEPSAFHNECMKVSPKVPISPRSPRSPLEVVKRLMKPSDSPISICSDSSGKTSPAVASGSPPVIPRVRIKTIKTTSGQIKRTVTSVLPDSETDEVHSTYESSPSQSMMSEDSYCNMSPHLSQSVADDVDVQSKVTSASVLSPKVLLKKSEANSRRSGTSPSAPVVHNTSSVKRHVPQQVQRQKRVSAATGAPTTNTNFLPKAMHLASLNLVPHSVAASVAARSTCSQQSQHALSSTVYSTVPLVHQVKTASPSPRAYIPNTAAGTLNRLLNNTNPVPTYVPNLNPPPESNINLPPRGYCCLECGDSFGFERSLAYHYNRRSVHIEVGCTHCAKTMVFFNKCALLAHAREHKSNGMVMQCTQLHMKPIAAEHMFVPLNVEPVNTDSYTSPSPSPKNPPVLPLYPDSIIRHKIRCLECNKQLPDFKALAGHYQRTSEDVEGLICKMCSMLLPNKCSFRAHHRIHTHKSPYVCPECGGLSRSADVQKHVKENCLHYARKAWYKCLHCDMVFKTIQGQKAHIEEKHCEVFYKCSMCPVALKTPESCEVHLKNKHGASKTTPQLIFKCSCETIFKKKPLLFQHFHQNAHKHVTCVFKCPECNSVFPQKHLLMQHFKSVHVGNPTAEAEKNSRRTAEEQSDNAECHQASHPVPQQKKSHGSVKHTDSPRKKAEQDVRPRVKPTGWTCGKCLQWFPERDSYVSHVKSKHGKSVKKYPCQHCEQSFNSTTSLRRHLRNDHHGKKKKTYTCWYCTDTKTVFTTSLKLKNHISLMHGIKNPDLNQMPKTATQQSKKALGKGRVPEKRSGGSKKEGRDRSVSVEAPSAKRPKTQFRCSKCGFTTDDSAQFQQHIPQHKTHENTPQCLHCGLCFTSVLSLNRHLYIVHKVKEPEEEEMEETKLEAKGLDNHTVKSAETDKVDNLSPGRSEVESPQTEEPASPRLENTTDCDLKVSAHSHTQTLSLR